MFAETELARTYFLGELTNCCVARGELSHAEYHGHGQLAEGEQAGAGLAQSEKKPDGQLPDGNQTEGGVADGQEAGSQTSDRNNPLGYDPTPGFGGFAVRVMEEGRPKNRWWETNS